MSLLSAIVLGLALGFILGGRPGNLNQLQLRWNGLMVIALAIQVTLFTGLTVPPPIVTVGYMLSGLLGLVWLGRNRRVAGVPCVFLGGLSNFVAIAVNGGRMPVDAGLLAQIRGETYVRAIAAGSVSSNSSLADSQTHLRWLTDIFLIPPPWPLPTVLSVGDLLIAAGVVWLIAAGMRRKRGATTAPTALAA